MRYGAYGLSSRVVDRLWTLRRRRHSRCAAAQVLILRVLLFKDDRLMLVDTKGIRPTRRRRRSHRHLLILVRGDYYSATSPPSTKADDYKAAVSELDATLKSFAPLQLTSLPRPIQKAVAWMRKEKDQAILKDKSLTPSAEMAHDLRLLRFLIGSKFDPVKATDEYISALKKRRDLKLDSLRDQVQCIASQPARLFL